MYCLLKKINVTAWKGWLYSFRTRKKDSKSTFISINTKENKLFHYDINFHKKNTLFKGSDEFMTV